MAELVGQDGILRPIGNRPSSNFRFIPSKPINNRPQDSILLHFDSSYMSRRGAGSRPAQRQRRWTRQVGNFPRGCPQAHPNSSTFRRSETPSTLACELRITPQTGMQLFPGNVCDLSGLDPPHGFPTPIHLLSPIQAVPLRPDSSLQN
jgi:hypothetical protein